MNHEVYQKNITTIPNWEQNNVQAIPLVSIIGKTTGTQPRQAGTDPNHVQSLMGSISMFAQQVPVTVELVGQDRQGNPTFRLVDGNHRFTAITQLHKLNKSDARWVLIKAVVEKFPNQYAKFAYQSDANSHKLVAKPSGINDAIVGILNIINNGLQGAPKKIQALHNSQGRNQHDSTKYGRDLNAAIKTLYPNLTDKERASAVRQLQGKRLPGRFARWTASEAKDSFVDWADTSGISYDEDFLHTVKNDNYIDWQLIARCFAAKDEAPRETFLQRIRNVWTSTEGAPENIVIMFWSDVDSKDNQALDEHRVKMINKINKRNKSWLLRVFNPLGSVNLVDRLFIAPQKRDGGCVETGFFEVPKNSRGEFSTTLTAKTGWDTEPKEAAAK
jgi:hypothetical protein